jgi:hypothetical protein
MTEPKPITLNLTLKELQQIDKYIEINDDTLSVLMKIKDAYPSQKSPVEEAYKEWMGEYPSIDESVDNTDDIRWRAFQIGWMKAQNNSEDISKVLIEGDDAYIMGIKYQRVEKPSKPMNEVLDRLENKYKQAEENAASYITDDVVDRMLKKYQAQKLWSMVREELGYSVTCSDEIVDLVERWIPEPQSAAGSQNVDTELLVDGFNDCVRKMNEMLR